MSDKPRLLPLRPAQDYTASCAAAMRGEPEAVSQQAQDEITAAAYSRDGALRAQRGRVYAAEVARVTDEIAALREMLKQDPQLHGGPKRNLTAAIRLLSQAESELLRPTRGV